METQNSVTVTVPATSANLGPGFDCLGVALNLHNHFRFTLLDGSTGPLVISATGDEADRVDCDASNLVYQSFVKLCEAAGTPVPPVQIEIQLGIPMARGLGSSATAIAAGLVGANYLLHNALEYNRLKALAIALEGHPDNIVPALLGGCQVCADRDGNWFDESVPWSATIAPVVAIPDFELSTAEARRVLPDSYSRADATFNGAHAALLIRAIETGSSSLLTAAMQDKIHQPYRFGLIHGADIVRQAAYAAGAYEVVISGAGPTLLALTSTNAAEAVAEAMQKAWQVQGIGAIAKVLQLDLHGTRINAPQ
ncbi:MAG: homoserine kinase [Cyanobacteria bacterium P01_D01_bin.73]